MFSAQKSAAPADGKLYVEDVFSTYLYTGNASIRSISNEIDLAGEGGMVWIKSRSSGSLAPLLYDTARGASYQIQSNASSAQSYDSTGLNNFNSDGFQIWNLANVNASGGTYASWTFRKAPKFFDVVTYTGAGGNKNIAHNLGVAPGCILIKCTSTASNWVVYHRGVGATKFITLNGTQGASTNSTMWNNTDPTSTVFTIGNSGNVNANGETYVAYLFAHDTTSDGIIQCGSFTTDGSGAATVTLGWEPQLVMVKRADSTGNWIIYDTMRGMPANGSGAELYPNTSGAENLAFLTAPTATGFSANLPASATYVYIAIRRGPMKTPTLGTSVFTPIAWSGTGSATSVTGTSYPVDMAFVKARNTNSNGPIIVDRLRNVTNTLYSPYTQEETANSYVTGSDIMNGLKVGTSIDTNMSSITYVYEMFRRAPGFFDEVCYTGTGVARTVNHNLGVVPEMVIIKTRNVAESWWTAYNFGTSSCDVIRLNLTGEGGPQTYNGSSVYSAWMMADKPTATTLSLTNTAQVNGSGSTYVAYLFASCPGVSKIGTYTGNGSNQTIDCGFAAGARFVLIKRTDSTGAWYVWDTARGIVAGNDPYFRLNSTLAEIASNDTIDTDSTGFVVNQVAATNVNVSSATYIYLAIA